MLLQTEDYVKVATLAAVKQRNCLTVQAEGHTLVLFAYGDQVYAVDNRCPHMGFPLDRGTVKDGILTCHWHHARFDLASGGTFDLWADDVPVFPVEVRDGEVWVDVDARASDPPAHQRERLRVGLERNISLVIAKAAIGLLDGGGDAVEPFRIGLDFGTRYRQAGWGQGLTMLTCFMNICLTWMRKTGRAPCITASRRWPTMRRHRPRVLACSRCPTLKADIPTLETLVPRSLSRCATTRARNAASSRRCAPGPTPQQMADMLFAAVTDHRYIQIGHPADFTNKAFEALDWPAGNVAEPVLTSLVRGYAVADRMEESNAWRNPIDLIAHSGGALRPADRLAGGGAGRGATSGRQPKTLRAIAAGR